MAIEENVSVGGHIILPITLLVGAWGVGGISGLIAGMVKGDLGLTSLFYSSAWAISAGVLYILYKRKNREAFYATVLGTCAVLFLTHFVWLVLNFPSEDTAIATEVTQILTHFSLVLPLFLFKYYREPILTQEDSSRDIFPFLAAYFTLMAIHNVLVVSLNGGHLVLALLAGLLPAILALGFSTRERTLGFYGSVAWLFLLGLPVAFFFEGPPLDPVTLPLQPAASSIALFIIVLKFRKTRLEDIQPKRSSGSGWAGSSGVSKSCGKCGKPVTEAARAGQRCPHCGAYWSYEDQKTTR